MWGQQTGSCQLCALGPGNPVMKLRVALCSSVANTEMGHCPVVSALVRALDILSVLSWGMGASSGSPAVPTSCWVLSQRMLTGQHAVFLTLITDQVAVSSL